VRTTNKTTALEQLPSESLKDSVATPCHAKSQRFIHIQRCSTLLRNLKTPLKSISVLSLVLLATPFIKPNAALAGGFTQTCNDIYGQETDNHYFLIANCRKRNGNWTYAQLRISDYIANYDGRLSWAKPVGNFQKSCREKRIVAGFRGIPVLLRAECGDGRGGWPFNLLNLDEKISNQDGVLDYDD